MQPPPGGTRRLAFVEELGLQQGACTCTPLALYRPHVDFSVRLVAMNRGMYIRIFLAARGWGVLTSKFQLCNYYSSKRGTLLSPAFGILVFVRFKFGN